ncbi:MAG TPA: hypothetical protein VFR81_09420 [Longimicrobium sp.]|nr:hypothetical protein [Longimicrobium sp.]
MKKIAILLAAGLLAAGPAAPCAADSLCSCAMPRTAQIAFERSDAVFRGVAIDVPPLPAVGGTPWPDERRVRIRVLERWKGDVPDTATVYTEWVDAVCGYPLEQGAEYVVYARAATEPNPRLTVHLCSGTKPTKDADEELRELRRLAAATR